MLNVKYQGQLGKPIPKAPNKVAADARSFENWIDQHQHKALALLCEHYRIKDIDALAWARLAMALAFDHVPAMRMSKAGRPRKMKSLDDVAPNQRGCRGRPAKFTDELLKDYLRIVNEVKAENGLRGHGSNRQAIKLLLAEDAKKRGKSTTWAEADFRWWERKFSEANRKFRK